VEILFEARSSVKKIEAEDPAPATFSFLWLMPNGRNAQKKIPGMNRDFL